MRYRLGIYLMLLLTACAAPQMQTPEVNSVAAEMEAKKQRALAIEAWVDQVKRLYRVGYPLLYRGVSLCGEKTAPALGLFVWSRHEFKTEWHEVLQSSYQLSDLVQVAYVVPDSPAAVAGVRVGDIPVAMGGWSVPVGKESVAAFEKKQEELEKPGTPIELLLRRGEQDITIHVTPTPACDFELALARDESRNAYADGKRIVVHSGMMDFFKSDEEAALVIAHELAHNAGKHVAAKKQNALAGGLLGLLVDIAAAAAGVNTQGQFSDLGARAGAMKYSVQFEREADYVGLYLMALSDYDISNVATFWRRMAIQNPNAIDLEELSSHHSGTFHRY